MRFYGPLKILISLFYNLYAKRNIFQIIVKNLRRYSYYEQIQRKPLHQQSIEGLRQHTFVAVHFESIELNPNRVKIQQLA